MIATIVVKNASRKSAAGRHTSDSAILLIISRAPTDSIATRIHAQFESRTGQLFNAIDRLATMINTSPTLHELGKRQSSVVEEAVVIQRLYCAATFSS
jgi:hypothetical protein